MFARQAWILHTQNPNSLAYREVTAASCDRNGMPWQYWCGYELADPGSVSDNTIPTTGDTRQDQDLLWSRVRSRCGFRPDQMPCHHYMNFAAAACSASHYVMWSLIAQQTHPIMILEHDSILLHRPWITIPNDVIVCLGYKLHDWQRYDHVKAGAPRDIRTVRRVAGSHAYAITPTTAQTLLQDLRQNGIREAIDNYFFVRDKPGIETAVPIAMTDPVAVMCWLRHSTIWPESCEQNYDVLHSFQENLKT